MKKIIVLIIAFFAGSQLAVSQHADHTEGGDFLKRIEYIFATQGMYNVKSKSIYERIFFGQTNSFVEFFFEDPTIASAFRIIRDSQKESCRMEVMQIIPDTNHYSLEMDDLSAGIEEINIPQRLQSQIPLRVMELVHRHNKEIKRSGYVDSLLDPHRPDPQIYKVSKAFAEKVHGKMTLLIDSFKAEGIPPAIWDGVMVTFRIIVGDEVWSLEIHEPQGNVRRLSDLCMQIITDAGTGKPDEAKDMELLEEIDFGNRPQ
jgi:hypothetical protein